ncbi:MAG: hypothetical protein ACLFOY_13960 [Desulfatibacillaceae bacterium]
MLLAACPPCIPSRSISLETGWIKRGPLRWASPLFVAAYHEYALLLAACPPCIPSRSISLETGWIKRGPLRWASPLFVRVAITKQTFVQDRFPYSVAPAKAGVQAQGAGFRHVAIDWLRHSACLSPASRFRKNDERFYRIPF